MNTNIEYLITKYREKMISILSNQELSLVEREFYSESSNWYSNENIMSMVDTLMWLTNNEKEKKDILDNELDEYFQ